MTTAPERGTVTVRRAIPEDAVAIRQVAHDAWRVTYHDLIGGEPVERFLAQAYTPDRVALRIDRHETFVGAVEGGDASGVDAFVEAMLEGDHAHIVAFYTRPGLAVQFVFDGIRDRQLLAPLAGHA